MSDPRGSGRGGAIGALLACVLGGLLLTGGTAGTWVEIDATRELGGVVLPAGRSVPGTEFAGPALVLGLSALLLGLFLGVARGVVRRVLGVLVAAVGVAGLVVLGIGLSQALGGPGRVVAGPAAAALGAVAVVAGGVLALRAGTRASLPDRYSIDREARAADHREAPASTDREARASTDREARASTDREPQAGEAVVRSPDDDAEAEWRLASGDEP